MVRRFRARPNWKILLAAAAIALVAWMDGADAAPGKAHPALRHVAPGSAISERFLTTSRSGERLIQLIVEGDIAPGLLRARGIEVNTVVGRRMTARCPVGLLQALLQMPGVDRVQVAERAEPNLDRGVLDTGATGLRSVSAGTFSGHTGRGIVVGLVDTGLDLDHADFRRDGHTRVVSLWDQTSAAGTPPFGYTYGAQYDSAQINSGLAPETDTAGHGTHVLGIAAGNGSATGNGLPAYTYIGMAPEAELVVVKTDFSYSSIIDGVSYIFGVAAALGKPAVVNLSLGSQDGPHDGTSDLDLMLNGLTGLGRIIVASAGNNAKDDLHGRVALSDTPQSMTLNVPGYAPQAGAENDYLLFSGWYPGETSVALTIVTPGGSTIGPIATGVDSEGTSTPDGVVNVYNGTTSPANGDHELYVEIYDGAESAPPRTGTWEFRFTATAPGPTGFADMYLFSSHLGIGGPRARWAQGRSVGGVVGTPGSADSVITAAAHTSRVSYDGLDGILHTMPDTLGGIAYFSSAGPRRDGAAKPDLSAPGHAILSSKSAAYATSTARIATDGVHVINSGTSMSAPHVTGAVALLLAQPSRSGGAYPSEIKGLLQASARADDFTGAVPNPVWGYGKLDIASAILTPTAVALEAGSPRSRFALLGNAPNPFNPTTTIRFELPEEGRTTLRIYDVRGIRTRTLVSGMLPAGMHAVRWDGRDDAGRAVASGIYFYELVEGGRRLTRRMSLLQ